MLGNRFTATVVPSDRYAALPRLPRVLLGRHHYTELSFGPRQRLVREGELQTSCFVILSGFAHRHCVTADGQRQITGVYVPGDIAGLGGAIDGPARQSIESAGHVVAAAISLAQLSQTAAHDAEIANGLWREAVAELAIASDWIVNIGRRSARERILHLLCELSLRFERAGVCTRSMFDLPLTQADIADATGLTAVHVNRVIRSLEMEGVIARRGRAITMTDWPHIAALADYDPVPREGHPLVFAR